MMREVLRLVLWVLLESDTPAQAGIMAAGVAEELRTARAAEPEPMSNS